MTSKKKTNKREDGRREDTFKRILQSIHGEDNVLSERMLLDSNGNKVTSGGTGRRVDFIVTDNNGNAIKSYEVTSKTADKGAQVAKKMQLEVKEVHLLKIKTAIWLMSLMLEQKLYELNKNGK
ncbi:hypothetical protein [Flavobacterium sp. 140616W15]|uniref:hypothetical protein n=1 Tax=Flavobacterium sp. 140616W15 TaxID=2478552 RepID=UPI000F0C6B49|nr:hypothetical protein [Flavobacterium sp. 140616W15]AYN04398.1 hypothetical protein EAG11_09555 [Flavobacterium sp. 140616W15]